MKFTTKEKQKIRRLERERLKEEVRKALMKAIGDIDEDNEIKKMVLLKKIQELMEDDDCLGYKEHKVLTLNTIYQFPIEEPKTHNMKVIKDFAMGCYREGWIHALNEISKEIKR